MRSTEIVARTEELVMPIIEENQFELVDVEYVKEGSNWYLRIYADKEGGINIDDCVLISRALEEKLDKEDFIKDAYILEVSSPGLGRPLKKDKDFARSIGKSVECKLYRAIDKKKEFEGVLKDYSKECVSSLEKKNSIGLAMKSISHMVSVGFLCVKLSKKKPESILRKK